MIRPPIQSHLERLTETLGFNECYCYFTGKSDLEERYVRNVGKVDVVNSQLFRLSNNFRIFLHNNLS